MRSISGLFVLFLLLFSSLLSGQNSNYVLVIHGGAGNIKPGNLPPAVAASYESKLKEVLRLGDSLLNAGSSSLDAVEACIG